MKKFTVAFAMLLGVVPTLIPACDPIESSSPREMGISAVERAYRGGEKVLVGRNELGEEVSQMSLTLTDTEVTVAVEFFDEAGEPGHLDIVIDGEGQAHVFGSTGSAELDWSGPMEELGQLEDTAGITGNMDNWKQVLATSPESMRGHVNDKREFRVSCSTACHVASIVGCLSGGVFAWACELVMVVVCESVCSQIDS